MRFGAYFVTGTDTGVGKTLITCALIHGCNTQGMRTLGLKPVAAGCEIDDLGEWRNEDATLIRATMSIKRPYRDVNPYALARPVSPHLAAAEEGVKINCHALASRCREMLSSDMDFVLIEGAGGWLVPLSEEETIEDLAKLLGFPVILVVGIRLGCLSAALLTADRIRRSGVTLAAWVGSVLDPAMDRLSGNIQTLENRLEAPCVGIVPYIEGIAAADAEPYLDIEQLMIR